MEKRILIIDDEENFCNFVKLNLEKDEEYEVLTATSGKEGVELAKEEKPDLILLDLLMPDMEGSVVAEKLLDEEVTKNIPIIFITGIAKKDEVKTSKGEVGGREFIAKPVKTEELKARIEKVLNE